MCHKDLFPHGVPDWFFIQHHSIDETGIGYEYQPMSRKVEELDNFTFHYRTIRNHEKAMQDNGWYDKYHAEWTIKDSQDEANANKSIRLAELEAQLAEAQKKIEDIEGVRRWNKQFVTERADLQKTLEEKDTRIAELEAQLTGPKSIDFSNEWDQDSPEYIVAIACTGDEELARALIAEKDARIAALEAELAAAQTTPSLTPEEATLTSPQKAALVKGEKTLKAWLPSICAMIKVAVRCGEDGARRRQQPDFNLMFNEMNVPLTGQQMKFFRACLPHGHIDRTGGAKNKD